MNADKNYKDIRQRSISPVIHARVLYDLCDSDLSIMDCTNIYYHHTKPIIRVIMELGTRYSKKDVPKIVGIFKDVQVSSSIAMYRYESTSLCKDSVNFCDLFVIIDIMALDQSK